MVADTKSTAGSRHGAIAAPAPSRGLPAILAAYRDSGTVSLMTSRNTTTSQQREPSENEYGCVPITHLHATYDANPAVPVGVRIILPGSRSNVLRVAAIARAP